MGLDMNPLPKPKIGYEAEFEDLWFKYEKGRDRLPDILIDNPQYLNLPKLTKEELKQLDVRFQEISLLPRATVGAPVVGADAAANDWLKTKFDAGQVKNFSNFAEAFDYFQGYYVLDLVPDCDGFPIYSHHGAYGGVDRTSFRGSFLDSCGSILNENQIAQAWNPMLSRHLNSYGQDLRQTVDSFAAKNGAQHVLGQKYFEWDDETSLEAQVHIVDQLARWCLFWSECGHGSDPYF